MQQHFIYHKSGERLIVWTDVYEKMLQEGDWFATPLEAEKAKELDIKKIEKEEKAKVAAKTKAEKETQGEK